MGVLNVTPDSFSDGSQYNQQDKALARAQQMIAEGADIIDIGGESTRPGAKDVSVEEELERVVPLVESIRSLDCKISVDTSKPEVMKAALKAGAHMINDVRALSEPGAMEVVGEFQVPVCLMHMQGQPRTMQADPKYQDVINDVKTFLSQRIIACEKFGITKDLICIDPGFGFGKTLQHNLLLLTELDEFNSLDVPVLAGLSRKSMLGQITGRDVDERLAASLAVALIALQKGAKIIRVHDVKETADTKKVFLATQQN
ncbi:MAG: dihydropteroate synthase [Kangiellaceae bacterium]|nr:dihydropteroate synthase [Kangiellaceae bacterium]MCW9017289.1 dihydropteroate synthase [Kangiellaceae bacterium]